MRDYDMHINVGGMERNEFLRWTTTPLSVGDELTIRIVDSPTADPPAERKRNTPAAQLRRNRLIEGRTKRGFSK